MSYDNGDHSKKRKADGGGATSAVGQDGDGLSRELMSAMNQLLDQNRLQMAGMDRIEGEMKSIKDEIKNLRDKCDTMEKSLQSAMDSRFDDVDTRFDDAEDKFRDVHNKQKYHEVLIKNQRWTYSAPFPNVSSISNVPNASLVR